MVVMFLLGIYKDIFIQSYLFGKFLQSTERFGLSRKLFSKTGPRAPSIGLDFAAFNPQ
jgi:hypothetical protein